MRKNELSTLKPDEPDLFRWPVSAFLGVLRSFALNLIQAGLIIKGFYARFRQRQLAIAAQEING